MYTTADYSTLVENTTIGVQGVTSLNTKGQDLTIGQSANNVAIGAYASSVTVGSPGVPIGMLGSFMGYAIMKDVKTITGEGGTNSVNTWNTRYLNTIKTYGNINCVLTPGTFSAGTPANTDSLFVLGPGTYMINASAPGYVVDRHQIRLRNTTISETIITGSQGRARVEGLTMTHTMLTGRFTVIESASTDFLVIEHITSRLQTVNGFGPAVSQGVNNNAEFSVYTQVYIYRLF